MKKRRDVAVECVEERIGVREMKWGDVTTGFTGIKTVKVWRVHGLSGRRNLPDNNGIRRLLMKICPNFLVSAVFHSITFQFH